MRLLPCHSTLSLHNLLFMLLSTMKLALFLELSLCTCCHFRAWLCFHFMLNLRAAGYLNCVQPPHRSVGLLVLFVMHLILYSTITIPATLV